MSDLNVAQKLQELGLDPSNSIVIGSGIMSALDIRDSADIDVVTSSVLYDELKKSNQFTEKEAYGRNILEDDLFEIGTSWGVLSKDRDFEDLTENSVVIDGVRYISLDFLYQVKKSWCEDESARQKDIDDVQLIKKYLEEEK